MNLESFLRRTNKRMLGSAQVLSELYTYGYFEYHEVSGRRLFEQDPVDVHVLHLDLLHGHLYAIEQGGRVTTTQNRPGMLDDHDCNESCYNPKYEIPEFFLCVYDGENYEGMLNNRFMTGSVQGLFALAFQARNYARYLNGSRDEAGEIVVGTSDRSLAEAFRDVHFVPRGIKYI